eukprot:5953444-Pyramimonas_sp.AAC.1
MFSNGRLLCVNLNITNHKIGCLGTFGRVDLRSTSMGATAASDRVSPAAGNGFTPPTCDSIQFTDQSDTESAGIFSCRTNQTPEEGLGTSADYRYRLRVGLCTTLLLRKGGCGIKFVAPVASDGDIRKSQSLRLAPVIRSRGQRYSEIPDALGSVWSST